MRAFLATLATLGLAATAPAAGGILLTGAGLGTYTSNDGATVCPEAPFTAQVLYTPDGRGALTSAFVGVTTCTTTVGLTALLARLELDTTQPEPVRVVLFCQGSEAAGMHCEALQGETLVQAEVGPSAGPGSSVTLSTRGAYRFDGTFTAL